MEIHTLRFIFNDRIIAALPTVARLVTRRFNRKYFHESALLRPQRYYQGHGAANAADHGYQLCRAAGSSGCLPR